MGVKRVIGILLIITSFIILGINLNITGAVTGVSTKVSLNVLSIVFLVGGIVLFLSREGGLEKRTQKFKQKLEQTLETGKIGTYDELRRIAKKMGYEIVNSRRHDLVYRGDTHIATIPRHKHKIKKGTYQSIIKELLKYT